MAVGLERAHAEFFSQRQSLAVVGFGLVVLWWLTSCRNVTEETVRMCLIATSWVRPGEVEKACGERTRLVRTTDEEQGLTQLGEHERMAEHAVPGGNALQHLVQEW